MDFDASILAEPHQALDAAREELPDWVLIPQFPIVGVLLLVLILGTSVLLIAWALRLPLRRDADAHWTERARQAWPARQFSATLPLILPLGVVAFVGTLRLPRPQAFLLQLVGIALMLAVAFTVSYRTERAIRNHIRVRRSLASYLWGMVLMWPGLLIALVVLAGIPAEFGTEAVAWLTGGMVVTLLLNTGLSAKLGRPLGLMRPAPERLFLIVRRSAAARGVAPPPTYLTPHMEPNAFAFPFARALAFSESMVESFRDDELAAVCDHELAHLSETTSVLLTRCAGTLFLLGLVAAKPVAVSYGLTSLIPMFAGFFAMSWCLARLSRRMEQKADAAAHSRETENGSYARALERLHKAGLIPAVCPGAGATHPHLYDRMLAAGITPEFPRPAPPSRRGFLAMLAIVALVAAAMPRLQSRIFDAVRASESESADYLAMLVVGEQHWIYGDLASRRYKQGRLADAAIFYGAAAAFGRNAPFYSAMRAAVLADAGHCSAAFDAVFGRNGVGGVISSVSEADMDDTLRWAVEESLTALRYCERLEGPGADGQSDDLTLQGDSTHPAASASPPRSKSPADPALRTAPSLR